MLQLFQLLMLNDQGSHLHKLGVSLLQRTVLFCKVEKSCFCLSRVWPILSIMDSHMFICVKETFHLFKNYAGLLQCNYLNLAIWNKVI